MNGALAAPAAGACGCGGAKQDATWVQAADAGEPAADSGEPAADAGETRTRVSEPSTRRW